MDDIAGPPKVYDYRYDARCQSFEYYAGAIIAKRRKDEHIGRSHPAEDLSVADPAAEGDCLLDSEGSCELFEVVPFRAVTDHGETGQTASQKGRSPAQSKITSLSWNEAADENQLKFRFGLGHARIVGKRGGTDAGFRDKKHFVAICIELGTHLRRSGYDRCRVPIGGSDEGHETVKIP
jgi:hypothetical protein